jgi:hypothetical protein
MRKCHGWTAVFTLFLLPAVAGADPVVPGFVVTSYATVTDPTSVSFAADGTLYTGADATGSGGGSGDAVKIHRIAAGGAPVEEFGDAAIFDPDGVLVDQSGAVSGTTGAVLVCGGNLSGQGIVSAVAPDQSITTVLGPTATLGNPNYMAFDSTGALLISDSGGTPGVYRFPAGGPLAFFLDPGAGNSPGNLAVDGGGSIFVSLSNGNIAIYDTGGTLQNGSFATGFGSGAALAFGPGGAWGSNLYAGVADTGDLVRIDSQGMSTTVGTGFTTVTGIAFGPDGALYVSEFSNDRVLRVAPEQATTTTTTATTTSTTLPGGDCAAEPVAATFVSIDCRLAALIAQVGGENDLGALQPKLLDQLQKAKTRKEKAETLCRQASKRRTRQALRPAINKVAQFLRTLGSRKARTIPQIAKDALRATADPIRRDMQALQRAVQCPQDAPAP